MKKIIFIPLVVLLLILFYKEVLLKEAKNETSTQGIKFFITSTPSPSVIPSPSKEPVSTATLTPTLTPTTVLSPSSRQEPDLAYIQKIVEGGDYIPCEGRVINDEVVGSGNTHLIKENVRWGRLTDVCIKPIFYMVHWTGKWIDVEHIKGSLEGNGLSCQFATDTNNLWALMNLYSDRVERAVCSGNKSNFVTINIEINGVCFDQALQGKLVPDMIPDESYGDFNNDVEAICDHFTLNSNEGMDKKYSNTHVQNRKKDLEIMTNKAVENACKVRKLYKIPVRNIIGHFDVSEIYTISKKYDPGREYMKLFRKRVAEECPIPED